MPCTAFGVIIIAIAASLGSWLAVFGFNYLGPGYDDTTNKAATKALSIVEFPDSERTPLQKGERYGMECWSRLSTEGWKTED
jgi:hypothetical protein